MSEQIDTQNDNANQAVYQPWYRVGMMWLAIGLPGIVVVASLITVVIAHKNAPLISHGGIPAQQQENSAN